VLRRALSTVLVVAVLAAGGCAQRSDSSGDAETTEDELPMKLTIRMRGDHDVTIEDRVVETKMIVVATADPTLAKYRVFGIEPIDPVGEGGIRVRPGVAIVPFEGDKRYAIEKGSPYDQLQAETSNGQASDPTSSVTVEWWVSDAETYVYRRRAEPCTVDVEERGTKGRLWCPSITEDGVDRRFSLELLWEKA
jgi:hypothetical protein